jgi:hypothetical protein
MDTQRKRNGSRDDGETSNTFIDQRKFRIFVRRFSRLPSASPRPRGFENTIFSTRQPNKIENAKDAERD